MGLLMENVFAIVKKLQDEKWENASLCMMGKLDIENVEWSGLIKKTKMFGFSYDEELAEKIRFQKKIDSYDLFKMFGFTEVCAVDYSDFEGANIVFDLNSEKLPDKWKNRFDFLINGGTLEHVFNQANAMRNMSDMVKVGGVIFHIAPYNGWIEHGFYHYSSTLFLDYYNTNDWKVDMCDICVYKESEGAYSGSTIFSQDCRLFDNTFYMEKYINEYAKGKSVMIRFMAKKKEKSTTHKIPIQGIYADIYKEYDKGTANWNNVIDFMKKNKDKRIAAYGLGNDFNKFVNCLYENDMENILDFAFETNIEKAGTNVRGYKVLFPTEEKLSSVDIVLITTVKYGDEIFEMLRKKSVKKEKIYKISDYLY